MIYFPHAPVISNLQNGGVEILYRFIEITTTCLSADAYISLESPCVKYAEVAPQITTSWLITNMMQTQLYIIVIFLSCSFKLSRNSKDNFPLKCWSIWIFISISQIFMKIQKQYVRITNYLHKDEGRWEHIIWFVVCRIVAQ